MQQKLESYFHITPTFNEKVKRCFIYDPGNYKASFEYKPEPTDTFIVTKLNVKLYYRKPTIEKDAPIPVIDCKYSVPLIKSNLQKAIRRRDHQIAIQSALALVQMAPMELLRRLPIIYIEDVCLMDSYPIVVWLMMADKVLTSIDIDILLHIVNSLCSCESFFPYVKNDLCYAYSHKSLQDSDALLSLHYRSLYGGMKGDMQMLKVSIDYYRMHPNEIGQTAYNCIDYSVINPNIDVLIEAIDFHCYPQMLHTLNKLTHIDKDTIKMCIWFVESGYNVRKPETQVASEQYASSVEWKKIEKHLEDVRYQML
jgi:hypothetical protein